MSNPRVDDKIKEKRGTARPDRKGPPPEEVEDFKKPRRPHRLQGDAAKFWYEHVDLLLETGALNAKTLQGFIAICALYGKMNEHKAYIDENGDTYMYMTSTGNRIGKRPEWEMYDREQKQFLQWCEKMNMLPIVPKTVKKAKSEKPPLADFSRGLKAVK